MAKTVHLMVEAGLNKGKNITVPVDGARLGRSSKNDIVLEDPLLSRHHCRLFFKPNEGMWVTDLGSANGTIVNGNTITEVRINVGDTVTIGDTILRVLSDSVEESNASPTDSLKTTGPVVDLGLKSEKEKMEGGPAKSPLNLLVIVGLIAVAAVAAIWIPKLTAKGKSKQIAPLSVASTAQTLELEYEKVLANTGNVFRYSLKISTNNMISVQIDDIKNDRHPRKEKQMSSEYSKSLAKTIMDSGFFSLSDEYQGIQPDIMEQWDLSITIGKKTHRTRVINRVEPEGFAVIREKIELAGKNELGLWAMESSPAKLIQMARDAHMLGKKYYDEREIKYGNLSMAQKSFIEADSYLETVDPKPDFYPDVVASITDCKKLLQDRYNDQNFRIERALKLGDWEESAKELRILLEMIPDGNDQRNKDARKKLLDVEKHLEKKR
ncbi:MAG: FHA domain-containing protein [Kiritimatiellae bacterium]|nr:FHA domain-containing protein [Kiritimatiellia bacterium]MDD5520407.1 FHA domain-containing protein [Kiritimatiellia bacterium]